MADVPESRLRSLPGTYALADSGTVEMWVAGDSLMIGATDAAGIALLAGHDSAQPHSARASSTSAQRVSRRRSTSTPRAGSFMHASIPDRRAPRVPRTSTRMLGDSVATHAVVVGTAVDSPTGARSYVRLDRD